MLLLLRAACNSSHVADLAVDRILFSVTAKYDIDTEHAFLLRIRASLSMQTPLQANFKLRPPDANHGNADKPLLCLAPWTACLRDRIESEEALSISVRGSRVIHVHSAN